MKANPLELEANIRDRRDVVLVVVRTAKSETEHLDLRGGPAASVVVADMEVLVATVSLGRILHEPRGRQCTDLVLENRDLADWWLRLVFLVVRCGVRLECGRLYFLRTLRRACVFFAALTCTLSSGASGTLWFFSELPTGVTHLILVSGNPAAFWAFGGSPVSSAVSAACSVCPMFLGEEASSLPN